MNLAYRKTRGRVSVIVTRARRRAPALNVHAPDAGFADWIRGL